jgi:hypothetical protein
MAATAAVAQTTSGAPPVSQENNLVTEKNQAKKGKVLFERTTDESGQTTDGAKAGVQAKPAVPGKPQISLTAPKGSADALKSEDAERAAETTTDFDLDVRMRPAEGHLAVRALVTVRNDGKTPLAHLRLQLGSELEFEHIRLIAQQTAFTAVTLNSDADHTGQLHEVVVTLAKPLEPGGSVQADVTYSGTITQTAKRLLALGTPEQTANDSDWDRETLDFTGLRGFGNVVWYPVASVPVILGDGNRLFDEIGEHKRRLAGGHLALRLTVETPPGQAPTVALVNGHAVELATSQSADASVAQVSTAQVADSVLGFEALSLFLAQRLPHTIANAQVWTRPESVNNVAAWGAAADRVTPFLQGWLGKSPRSELTVLELPEDTDTPFETGALFAAPVRAASADVLDGVMAHALTHAWVQSKRAWLNEGVAHFMGTLWTEKQQGRERALATLEAGRQALTLAEPESPGAGDGQPLVTAIAPVYYRTKAAYVFWMLRGIVGDQTLSAALRAYNPATDTENDSFEKLVEQAGDRRDLRWFFNDWVYADKGLPDLSIDSVFPSRASVPGSWLVAVNVANIGYAAAEVPVQVISDSTSVTQRVVLAGRSKAVLRVLIEGQPTEVRANDGTIPEVGATIHSKMLEAVPAK